MYTIKRKNVLLFVFSGLGRENSSQTGVDRTYMRGFVHTGDKQCSHSDVIQVNIEQAFL